MLRRLCVLGASLVEVTYGVFPRCVTFRAVYICLSQQERYGTLLSQPSYESAPVDKGLLCAEDHVFSLYLAVRYYVSGVYLTAQNVLLCLFFSLSFC